MCLVKNSFNTVHHSHCPMNVSILALVHVQPMSTVRWCISLNSFTKSSCSDLLFHIDSPWSCSVHNKTHISSLSNSHLSKLAVTGLRTWAPEWGICPGLVTVGLGVSWLLCADRPRDNVSESHVRLTANTRRSDESFHQKSIIYLFECSFSIMFNATSH